MGGICYKQGKWESQLRSNQPESVRVTFPAHYTHIYSITLNESNQSPHNRLSLETPLSNALLFGSKQSLLDVPTVGRCQKLFGKKIQLRWNISAITLGEVIYFSGTTLWKRLQTTSQISQSCRELKRCTNPGIPGIEKVFGKIIRLFLCAGR